MLIRKKFLQQITNQFEVHALCALLGPRQCGKTTLSKDYARDFQGKVHIFDLENPTHLARLENPLLALSTLNGLVIIDEIQRRPELFPILRVLVDEMDTKFLILGSASRDLIQQSSETLAGRIGYVELTPFHLEEVEDETLLWVRGGFPKSYLAEKENASFLWRENYIRTFLERDIPSLGFSIAPQHLRRFWMMLAHYHGNLFNASEIGRSLSISDHTAKKYLDILSGTFMVRSLPPWFENTTKRQIKTPKIYFRDTGIFHTLMGLHTLEAIQNHPKLGASWEGFALEQVIQKLDLYEGETFFWRTHAGAELDLFILKEGKKFGFEFKYTDAPKVSSSMRSAFESLDLNHLFLICPGHSCFLLRENITAIGLKKFIEEPFINLQKEL